MTTPEAIDPLLEEVNTETQIIPERVRAAEHWRCRFIHRDHEWGIAYEDRRSKRVVNRRVCVRGQGSLRGRCPAWHAVVVPSSSTDQDEPATLPEFYLPVAEILRLRRWDWGTPLPYPKEASDA